jgi:CheY-like chemotaxis protein
MARVLLVDDDPVVRIIATEYLGAQGHSVRVVESGAEAFAELSNCPADLIVLDMIMPDMNGIEVLVRLKSEAATKDTPVIILSADIATAEKVSAGGVQPDSFLQKPFQAKMFLALVSELTKNKI